MTHIAFENVDFTYDGSTLALDGLDCSIGKGTFLCILGGNGSGKSTFAKCMNALLVPDSGKVLVEGMDTADPDLTFLIRSNAGMVFQNPDDQIVATLVEDDVAFGPENLGVAPEELQQRVKAALATVGLAGFEGHRTQALSGGQKQRVALAGVLAMEPQIVILDEAAAMLDPRGRRDLMKLCQQLHSQGFTIILITHFMEQAAETERAIVLAEGRVVLDGPPRELFANPRKLRELALEPPFAAQMAELLRSNGVPAAPVLNLDELVVELQNLLGTSTLEDGIEAKGAAIPTLRQEQGRMRPSEPPVARERSETSVEEAPSAEAPELDFRDVWFSYHPESERTVRRKRKREAPGQAWGASPGQPWVLSQVSFTLEKGHFLGIAGHTGSGKSTLIQLANGLLSPTRGRVLVEGRDLADKATRTAARRRVGVVFQYPERQLFAATVADDVAFGPRNLGLSPEQANLRVREALERVHLSYEHLADRSPFSLSGGQQRRVALAGVLAMEPQTLILDEPAAGLDPQSHRRLLALVEELHHQAGLTVVMVSHNMDDLGQLADRMLVLNQGLIWREGAPLDVFADEEALRSVGLDVPRTLKLARSLGISGALHRVPSASKLVAAIAAAYRNAQGSAL